MTNLLPEFFRRADEQPDALFYEQPRKVKHIDDAASGAAEALYNELLPARGQILDLMSGYHSHLPDKFRTVTGLGLNLEELEENPAIDQPVIHDINLNADLPFSENQFDGAVCTVSIQYMTRPDDTFKAIARVLKPGAPFVVTFSNRMFPTKAVLAWRASDEAAHMRLIKSYFSEAPDFGGVCMRCFVPEEGDPLYAAWSYKQPLPLI